MTKLSLRESATGAPYVAALRSLQRREGHLDQMDGLQIVRTTTFHRVSKVTISCSRSHWVRVRFQDAYPPGCHVFAGLAHAVYTRLWSLRMR